MKPERWTLKELAGVITRRMRKRLNRMRGNLRDRFGFWYCGHCNRYHSPLVKKFDTTQGQCDPWCSLGSDEEYPDDY